ncbi:MAG TPA: branched-chain amino acid ABC transporter permease [Actinomycetota bacterium]|nr:branched-chain amino acid ABC transporter permease [Actinomycetota bacterium]
MLFVQHLINGLTIGAVYALIAVGFSLVWATLRSVNFAHGDLYMLGAYVALGIGNVVAASAGGWHPALAVLVILLAAAVTGLIVSVGIERAIFRPLRRAPEAVPILATLGASILIQNVVFLAFGSAFNSFPLSLPRGPFTIAGARANVMQVAMVGLAVLVILGLHVFLGRTKLGTAMRATSWDREVAALMGVDVNRVIQVAFAIAGALAGAAGAFVGFYYGVITFFMGFLAAVKGFTAAVFGGFGNVRGALLGGLLLGVFEALAAGYVSGRWKDAIAFVVLILIILVRPTGIIGERLPARV